MTEVKDIVHLVIPSIFAIIWLIRLESKILYIEKDHNGHKSDYKDQVSVIYAKQDTQSSNISLIMQSLARIEENIKNLKSKES